MAPRSLFGPDAGAAGRPPRVAAVPGPAPDPGATRPSYEVLPPAPGGGALSRCSPCGDGRRLPFEWTLNPFRGCEFACGYCYARYTHRYLGMEDPRDFERRILVKEGLPRLLERDLAERVAPGHRIALGTATDPYQPAERSAEATRGCLRVFARHAGLRLSITTKSDLVLRDLDLLRVIARRSSLHVNVTVTTLDRRLARGIEPGAPTPARRLAAVRALAAEGIESGVFLMPVLPGLTDDRRAVRELCRAAAASGARYLCHQVVFLREPTRSVWMGVLRARFPALLSRYERWFGRGGTCDEEIRRAVARRVSRARSDAGLADGPTDRAPADPQLTLAFAG